MSETIMVILCQTLHIAISCQAPFIAIPCQTPFVVIIYQTVACQKLVWPHFTVS